MANPYLDAYRKSGGASRAPAQTQPAAASTRNPYLGAYRETFKSRDLADKVNQIAQNRTTLNTQQQYNVIRDARNAGLIDKKQQVELINFVGDKAVNAALASNKPPQWQKSIYDIVNVLNEATVKPITGAISNLGQAVAATAYDIGTTVSGEKARLQKQIQENETAFMKAINQAKQKNITPEAKARYLRQAQGFANMSNTLRQQQVAQAQDVVASTSPQKVAGSALTLGSLFIPGGRIAAGVKGAAAGTRAAPIATGLGRAVEGGVTGGAFGTGIAMQEGKPLPEIARSALETALLGAGIGVIAPPLLAMANKGLQKAGTSIEQIYGRIKPPKEPTNIPVSQISAPSEQIPVSVTKKIPVSKVETGQLSMRQMNDAEFAKQMSKISANYDKEMAKVSKMDGKLAQQVAARQIDARYEKTVNSLVDNYSKGKLVPTPTAPVKPVEAPVAPAQAQVAPEAIPAPEPVPVTPAAAAVPEAPVAPTAPPAAPVSTAAGLGEQKIAGGALKAEARAVENKLVDEFQDLPTYATVSFKDEAALATNLVRQDRQAAIDIAIGKAPARNDVQRAAVASALEREAMKANDVELLQKLASSPRYTRTSEAAQTLGAEGFFFDPTSPSILINQLKEVRKKAFEFRKRTSTDKLVAVEASKINKSIKAPTKDDWNSFIESLRC